MALAFGATIVFVILAARSMPGNARRAAPDARVTAMRTPADHSPGVGVRGVRGVRAVLTAGDVRVERSLPGAAFGLDPGQTLDARLPPGPFTAVLDVAFVPGAVAEAAIGAHLQGGQLIIRRGDTTILSNYAGDEPRAVWPTAEVPPLRFGGDVVHLTFEFTATGSGPHALRPLWKPADSLVPFPLPAHGAALVDDPALRGRVIARTNHCVACHESADPQRQTRLARHPGPILGDVGARRRPAWLRRRLLDPDFDPPYRMPRVGPAVGRGAGAATPDRAGWAEDLTHFLVSMGGPMVTGGDDEGDPDPALVATGRVAYHTVGCFACHGPLEQVETLPPGHGAGSGAGVPLRTYVPLGAQTLRTTIDALAAYLANPLAAHPGGLMPDMRLNTVEATAIASYLVAREPAAAPAGSGSDASFVVDPARVARGREHFAASGCANCHDLGPDRTPVASTLGASALESLTDLGAGCLAPAPPPGAPDFGLAAADRADIAAFLLSLPERRSEDVPVDDLSVTFATLDCLACHSYEAELGPEAAVAAYFAVDGEADLGDEGRLPPTLTDAGGRLTESWMRDVLTGEVRARPYLGARMPRFDGASVDRVPERLARASGATDLLDAEPAFSLDGAGAGRALVGASALNCIQCHEIAGNDSTGTPGPDLALMPGRVRYDWFARWLHDPARVRPGTRMPSFFVGGRGAVTEVLGGDATAQIEAVWSYLSQGETLALPDGLVDPAGLELVVADEPIVFRTFMADAGVRAIACGFPEQVHCAFDSDRCQVTLVWQGRFLSAGGAWAARGGSETNPEETVWSASDGPFLEIAGAGESRCRFRGYTLDAARRPRFSYDVARGDVIVSVTEQPVPRFSGDRPRLVRTFGIDGPPRTRVTVPAEVVALTAGTAAGRDGDRAVLVLDETGRLEFEVEVTW